MSAITRRVVRLEGSLLPREQEPASHLIETTSFTAAARLSEDLVRIPLKEGFDMSYASKWPVPPRCIESMVIDDLSFPSGSRPELR